MDEPGDFTCDCSNDKCVRDGCKSCCYCGAERAAPQPDWHPNAGTWVSLGGGDKPFLVEEVHYDYRVARLESGIWVAFSCLTPAPKPADAPPTFEDLLTDIQIIKGELPCSVSSSGALARIEDYIRMTKEK
jgi:hypothetical protein